MRGKAQILVFIFLGTFISPCFLHSQNLASDTIHLREVEVRSSFIVKSEGFKKIRIDSSLLSSQLNVDLSTILAQHSTVFMKTYGNGSLATPLMRGTTASHIQVEWNGISINSPMLGMTDFSQVPVFEFNNVEILYGAASIQKTGGAFGGVINLITNPNWNNQFHVTGTITGGSFDSWNDNLSVSTGNATIQSMSKIYCSYAKNDFPYFDDSGIKQIQQNGQYGYSGASEEVFIRLAKNNFFSARIWYNHALINLAPLITNTLTTLKEKQENSDIYSKVEWKRLGKNNSLTIWSGVADHLMKYSAIDLSQTETDNHHSYTWMNRLKWIYSGIDHLTIKPGIDYNYELVKSDGYDSKKSRSTVSASSEFIYTYFRNLSLNFVVRQDLTDTKFLPVIAALGMEYDLTQNHRFSLTANLSKNYKYPTLNDLYWKIFGNPDLKAETDYSGEAGAVFNAPLANKMIFAEAQVTGYYSFMKDLINWKPGTDGKFRPENVAEVLAKGIEAGLNLKFDVWGFLLDINNNYNYCRSINQKASSSSESSVGKQLIYIPVHVFNTTATLRKWNGFVSWNFSYFSERFTSSDNTSYMEPYYLNNIILGKNFHFPEILLSLQLQINNLLDLNYQSVANRAMPGRNIAVTLKINFGR